MVILDVSIVNVALPVMQRDLHMSQTELQWVVNAYALTFGGLLLLGGRAADLLGRRRMLVAGLCLFSLASLLGGLAQSGELLVAARGLQGIGSALLAPVTLAVVFATFRDPPSRGKAMGQWGAIGAAGGSAGVVLGGLLTEALSWRWILFVNVPIGVVLVWRALRVLPDDRADAAATRGQGRFDLAGAVSVTLGLGLLVYGIVSVESAGWGGSLTLHLLGGAIVLLAAFVAIERYYAAPLMPLRIFAVRSLSAGSGAFVLLGAAMFAMWFFVSLYLQRVLGYTALEAGLAFLPMTAVVGLGALRVRKVVARFGPQRTVMTGFALLTAGLIVFSQARPDGTFLVDVLPASMYTAVGSCLCFVPLVALSMSGVVPQESGLASGVVNVARQVGGAIGLATLATVATAKTSSLAGGSGSEGVRLMAGFELAFFVAAGFAAAGGVLVWWLLRPQRGVSGASPTPSGPPAVSPSPGRG